MSQDRLACSRDKDGPSEGENPLSCGGMAEVVWCRGLGLNAQVFPVFFTYNVGRTLFTLALKQCMLLKNTCIYSHTHIHIHTLAHGG